MAHQWFGNIVTPTWWDDLWLNESFAEYMGNRVTADVTEYADAWTDNAYARRQWGLVADQRPSTHPVAGNGAVDASAALQDFDGISYAKGSSDPQAAQRHRSATRCSSTGVIDHFTRHRFGNATMHDLFASWERAGAGDLSDFTDNWLRTAGPDTIELDRAAGVVRRTPPGGPPRRPAAHASAPRSPRTDGTWTDHVLDLEAPGDAVRRRQDRPVLLDPYDDTWALLIPDQLTVDALESLLPGHRPTPLLRAGVWNNVRSALHNAAVDPADVLDLVVAQPAGRGHRGQPRAARWPGCYRLGRPAAARPGGRAGRSCTPPRSARSTRPRPAPSSSSRRSGPRSRTGVRRRRCCAAWLAGDRTCPRASRSTSTCAGGSWSGWRRSAPSTSPSSTGSSPPSPTGGRPGRSTPGARVAARRRGQGLGLGAASPARSTCPTTSSRRPGCGMWRGGQEQLTAPYVERYFADLPDTVEVRSGWVLAEAAEDFFPLTSLTRTRRSPGPRR